MNKIENVHRYGLQDFQHFQELFLRLNMTLMIISNNLI